MTLILHGYRYSVYVRIVRLVLAEKGLAYEQVEVNPFAADVPANYLTLHPFGRVPTLVHDGFGLYETGAITRYVDRAFPGPSLQPADPKRHARMDQIVGVDGFAADEGIRRGTTGLHFLQIMPGAKRPAHGL